MVEELSLGHPEAIPKIEKVVNEHPQMLKELRDIMTDALTYSEGTIPIDERLRHRVTGLLDHLEEHEHEETNLIQRLEYRDLGVGD